MNLMNNLMKIEKYKALHVPTNEFGNSYFQFLVKEILAIDPNVEVERGISKIVINDPDLTVVVKIPYIPTLYDPSREKEYSVRKNYCQMEFEAYCNIPSEFEEFFAKTYKVDDSHYTQEKCVVFCDVAPMWRERDFHSEYVKKYQSRFQYMEDYFLPDFMLDLINAYGEEKVARFFDFLSKDDPLSVMILEDMHESNYGYRKSDGTPCLFDFSGWEGWSK